ncbi:MAG: HEAT repeat domain-containing protein [Candidatus Methylomirabilia bacterium]
MMSVTFMLLVALAAAGQVWAQPPPADLDAAIERLASGTDTLARMKAAERLGASKHPRALDPLLAALHDPNRDVRWAAIQALGDLGDRRAVRPLVHYLEREEAYRWGRRLVANALGAIGDPEAVDPLLRLLTDEDPFARRLAAIALLWIGEPRAMPRVAELLRDTSDPTLATVKRELARAEAGEGPRLAGRMIRRQDRPAPPRPREWAGLRVGVTTLQEARKRLGPPLQESPNSLLFRGEPVQGPLRSESVVVNADAEGVIESIFVFPAWGTLDLDVRALLGPGNLMTYGEFLRLSGRTAHGAGTRAEGKLHYLPLDLLTESYPEMGILTVYDSAEVAARDRLVKLLIVY